MTEQFVEGVAIEAAEVFQESFPGAFDKIGIFRRGSLEDVDIAEILFVPAAVVEATQIHAAVGTEFDVGIAEPDHEDLFADDGKTRARFFYRERFEIAVRTAEVADPEVAGVSRWHRGGSVVVDQTTRSPRDLLDGRQGIGGAALVFRLPDRLGHPRVHRDFLVAGMSVNRSAELELIAEIHQDLMPVVPARVAALDEIDEAARVPGVGVVVAGEKVAKFVKGELLRIAQARVDLFEIRSVGITAENAAGVGTIVVAAFLRREMIAAVADGPVEFSIRPPHEPVHVVARDAHAHAEAILQGSAFVGTAVAVGVAEMPEMRDVRVVDVVLFPRDQTDPGTVEDVVKAIGPDARAVGAAVTVGVFDADDAVGELGVKGERTCQLILLVHPVTIFVGAVVDVVEEEALLVADVLHSRAPAVDLGNVETALGVKTDRAGVLRLTRVGEEARADAPGQLEITDANLRLAVVGLFREKLDRSGERFPLFLFRILREAGVKEQRGEGEGSEG